MLPTKPKSLMKMQYLMHVSIVTTIFCLYSCGLKQNEVHLYNNIKINRIVCDDTLSSVIIENISDDLIWKIKHSRKIDGKMKGMRFLISFTVSNKNSNIDTMNIWGYGDSNKFEMNGNIYEAKAQILPDSILNRICFFSKKK